MVSAYKKYNELKRIVESEGVDFACDQLEEALRDGYMDADNFSIRKLAETFMGQEWVSSCDPASGHDVRIRESAGAAVMNLAFSNITGQMIYSKVMEGWNTAGLIGDQLVDVVQTQFEQERIPGVTKLGNRSEGIGEGEPYPVIGFQEEFVDTPRTTKHGAICAVTKETVFFDRTGLVMRRASEVGEALSIRRERAIIDACTGATGAFLYKRNGDSTPRAMYLTAAPYINTVSSNALADWTDIENAELAFDALTDPNTGEPIQPRALNLLVPSALKHTAKRIVNATEIRVGNAATAGNVNTISANPVAGDYGVLSSPYVKVLTGSASTWFLGDFKRAVWYMQNWPITVVQAPDNSEAEFSNDIVLRFKASEKGTPAISEPRYCVKNTA